MERKFQEAGRNPRIYANRCSLWKAKRLGTYSNKTFKVKTEFYGEEITLTIPVDFRYEFKKNQHKALRDLAAIPSLAVNPYMDGMSVLDVVAGSTRSHPVARESKMGYPLDWQHWWKPVKFPVAIHVDLSKSRDACGLAVGWWDGDARKATWGLIHQIRTSVKDNLDYSKVRQIILDMRLAGWKIHVVSYDNFQSVDSRQILEKKGLRLEYLSCDKTLEPYDTLQAFINQGEADFYDHPVLVRELKRLELVNGMRVDHPPHGSKDVADAVAGVAYWIGQMRSEFGSAKQRVIANIKGRARTGWGKRHGR